MSECRRSSSRRCTVQKRADSCQPRPKTPFKCPSIVRISMEKGFCSCKTEEADCCLGRYSDALGNG